MTSFDSRIAEALGHDVPLRIELKPAWDDVLVRARRRKPVRLRRKQHLRRRGVLTSRRTLGTLAAAAALTAGGLATARAAGLLDFGPLHRATVYEAPVSLVGTSGQVSTCELIGKRAYQVGATLASRGIGIEWRFQHWGDVVETTGDGSAAGDANAARANAHTIAVAVSGGSSDAVSSVPDDSIVWSATPDPQSSNKAFVFAEAPNDPNAPTISLTDCP